MCAYVHNIYICKLSTYEQMCIYVNAWVYVYVGLLCK